MRRDAHTTKCHGNTNLKLHNNNRLYSSIYHDNFVNWVEQIQKKAHTQNERCSMAKRQIWFDALRQCYNSIAVQYKRSIILFANNFQVVISLTIPKIDMFSIITLHTSSTKFTQKKSFIQWSRTRVHIYFFVHCRCSPWMSTDSFKQTIQILQAKYKGDN